MAEYAKTSEITPLIAQSLDLEVLESMTGDGTSKDNTKSEAKENGSLWRNTNTRQKFLLLFVIMGQFTTYNCASLPSPFLARLIVERGGHVIESTVVLQVTIFTMACSSLVFGKYQSWVGSKMLLVGGIGSFGVCQAMFGLLAYVGNIHVFVAAGIVLRILQGIGHGAYAVASLTLVCQEFSHHVGQVFGITESAVGVGYLTGPMLGSLLYSISGGILIPFVTSGIVLLLMVPIGIITVKNETEIDQDRDVINATKVIGTPGCLLILGLVTAVYGGYGIFNVTVSLFLELESFTVIEVGMVLFVCSLSYCVTSVVIGFVAEFGVSIRRAILILGLIGFAGTTFMFHPDQTKPWIYVGSSLLGIFGGFSLICSFSELINLAAGNNMECKNNFSLHSTLSGSWNFVFGIGTFLFPLAGSEMQKVITFSSTMLIVMLIGYCLAFILPTFMFLKSCCTSQAQSKIPDS